MSQARKPWTQQEDEVIKILVKKMGTKKWSNISIEMGQKYGIYGRSGKQCRQRWHNHLNPFITKKPWTAKQEKIIFESYQKYGNKWTQISNLLSGRTDNAIKNHFYSTLRRRLRRISKLLGQKNSTSKMREIKPSVLSKIFFYAQMPEQQIQSQNQQFLSDCKYLSEILTQYSLQKINSSFKMQTQQKQKIKHLLERLLKFNENYLQIKKGKKKNTEGTTNQQQKQLQMQSFKEQQFYSNQQKQSLFEKVGMQKFQQKIQESLPFVINQIEEIQQLEAMKLGINISPSNNTFLISTPTGPTPPVSAWNFQFPIQEIYKQEDLQSIAQNIRLKIEKSVLNRVNMNNQNN